MNSARPHVPEEELHAFCDGELSPSQRAEIAEHLLGCLICRSQHAEVEALRLRASTLLAIAAPAAIRRPGRVPAVRRRSPRLMAAAALVVVATGAWFSLHSRRDAGHPVQLAISLGVPDIFRLGSTSIDQAAVRNRQLTLAHRASTAPAVHQSPLPALVSAAPVGVAADVDPVATSEWPASSMNDAVRSADSTLARLPGIPVTLVRMHPSAGGGRPTFMVRQKLPDGHAVWVFEGLADDIAPLDQALQASGLSMSMPTRTRPDYVGSGVATAVTVRMVQVVGYLPVDSLNALASQLVLH